MLSQSVSRRDELVLKRMRTGESRDAELLASIALPGAAIALVLAAIVIPIAAALGRPLPVNPVLYAVTAILAVLIMSTYCQREDGMNIFVIGISAKTTQATEPGGTALERAIHEQSLALVAWRT